MRNIKLSARGGSHWTTKLAALMVGTVLSWGVANAAPLDPYEDEGPYSTTRELGLSCTVFRPSNLTGDHPIVVWGNGTGTTPTAYRSGLEHWASWGFVVAAANTSNAGTGQDMLDCIGHLQTRSYAYQLDFSAIGASGHSQGGGGTIMAARDSRITATAPVQPYILGLGHDTTSQYQQTAPMLLLSGSFDVLAGPLLNQRPVYQRVDVPVFWAERAAATHFEPVGDFGDFKGITTAWWLYQLSGDSSAADLFTGPCTACNLFGWDIERKNF